MFDWLGDIFSSGSSGGSSGSSTNSWLPALITSGAGLWNAYSNRSAEDDRNEQNREWQLEDQRTQQEWQRELFEMNKAKEEALASMNLEAALAAIKQRMYEAAISGQLGASQNVGNSLSNLVAGIQRPYLGR